MSLPASPRRGFTLTELAIVLGIIGLILGAIWTAASKVYANNRVTKSVTETLSIAGSVRSMFAGKGVLPGGDLTQFGVNAGFYPADMPVAGTSCAWGNASPCPRSVWGTDVVVASQVGEGGVPTAANKFDIWFVNNGSTVPAKECPAFMAAIIQQAANSGLVEAWSDSSGGFAVSPSFPITSTQVTNCYGTVIFTFTL